MSRIAAVFARERKALIGYLTVGYPSPEKTVEAGEAISAAGCDIIELGIPFSDPIADGVTIQKAGYGALRQGVTVEVCLDIARRLRKRVATPLVFMTYYNPVLHYGLERFCRDSVSAGVDGLIVPDLPPEEGKELEDAICTPSLALVYLLAPTSSAQRIALVGKRSHGFIYLVSVAGVTGARDTLPEGLEEFVARVRRATSLPLCVGFGVSTPAQAQRIARVADGVIVGSRLIQLIDEDKTLKALGRFVGSLRKALDGT